MHGVGDVPARMHSARLTHGKLQAFCGSTQSEVEAGTRTVKGLDLSKGPKLQPHSISCWRLEDCNRGKKRAACVMQVRQDFAIMRFCTPRLVCQGPYCTWKIYVCSAFHVPAESCKIVRLFVLWWSHSILRHSLLVRCWRPIIHYPTVLHDIFCQWDTTGACDGKKRSACVMQVCQDFAIMRFCTPRLLCQGPYCTWKIYACSAVCPVVFVKQNHSLLYMQACKKNHPMMT